MPNAERYTSADAAVYQAKYAAAIQAGQNAAKIADAEIAAVAWYTGKDAAERTANAAKIKKLSEDKNEALRSSLVTAAQLRTAYEYDYDKPARDAETVATDELLAINDQIDATERQIATYSKLRSAITAASPKGLEALDTGFDVNYRRPHGRTDTLGCPTAGDRCAVGAVKADPRAAPTRSRKPVRLHWVKKSKTWALPLAFWASARAARAVEMSSSWMPT